MAACSVGRSRAWCGSETMVVRVGSAGSSQWHVGNCHVPVSIHISSRIPLSDSFRGHAESDPPNPPNPPHHRAPSRRTLHMGIQHRTIDLAATARVIPGDQEAGSAERSRLYHSARWQRARLRFLADNPLCIECHRAGIVAAAVAVDHRDGHQRGDWRTRFWDETRWQPLCVDHHNRKSASELAEWNRAAGSVATDA
jgi:5-methylcytosine-specific restriction enzyme A